MFKLGLTPPSPPSLFLNVGWRGDGCGDGSGGDGMNAAELASNPVLSQWGVYDLNAHPDLVSALRYDNLKPGRATSTSTQTQNGSSNQINSPISDSKTASPPSSSDTRVDVESNKFDAVICNVSIDYLTSPLEIMGSIGDVLKKGGWGVMVISNRCFPTKVSR